MKRKKENKNDKIILFMICFFVFAFLSWIISGSTYQSGQLVDIGMYRAGLYDLVAVIISGITYKIEEIIYILFVGGMYGILAKTNSYKKIVQKTVCFIKEKEAVVFAIVTLFVGLYTSISSSIMTLFFLVPFIMTVFLKSGQDKLTAISASFGGLLLGYIGQTFGTYGVMNTISSSTTPFLLDYLSVGASSFIMMKVIIFLAAYILFNVFAIIHMKNNKKEEIFEEDMFAIQEVNETPKKKARIVVWPTVLIGILSLIVIMIGYISWNSSFNLSFFDELHSSVMSFSIADVKIIETIFGSTLTAFGSWNDFLPAIFLMFVNILVVVITNKMSFVDTINNFGEGVRKIAKVAIIYGLAFSFLYLMTAFPWPTSLVDAFIPTDSFNIVLILVAAILAVFFCADPSFAGYYYGSYLAALFSANAAATAVVWRLGSSFALLLGPTSFILLAALTYADVPYTKWLKYIWKFALIFVIAALIILAVVVYI